jgi:serine/threonine protein kinase
MMLGLDCYDAEVDVWALGCLVVQLHTGIPPFYRGPGSQQQREGLSRAECELQQLVQISERLRIPVEAFFALVASGGGAPTTRSRCRSFNQVLHQIRLRALPSQDMATHAANAGGSATVPYASLRREPGRRAPTNAYFENFLLTEMRKHNARHRATDMVELRNTTAPLPPDKVAAVRAAGTDRDQFIINEGRPTDYERDYLDVVVWMLQPDPANRPNLRDVLTHPYFRRAAAAVPKAVDALRTALSMFEEGKH